MAQLKDSTVHGNLDVTTALTAVDVTISGNLIIRGTTTTIDTTTSRIEDSALELGGGPDGNTLLADDGHDRGVILHYYEGSAKSAFIGYKDGQIVLSANSTYSNNDVTLGATNAIKGNIVGGYFVGNGDYLTNLTGSEVTGTVAQANNSSYAGNVTGATQTNITQVGTLTTLVVGNGTANSTFGNGTISTTGLANLDSLVTVGNANIGADLRVTGNIYGNLVGEIAAKGSNTQVQFNDGGQQNATSGLTFTKANSGLQVGGEVRSNTLHVTNSVEIGKTANVGNLVTLGYGNIETGNIGNLTVQVNATVLGLANVNSLESMTTINSKGNLTANNITSNNHIATVTLLASGNLSTQANVVASGWANITLTANVGNLESLGKIYSVDEANVSQLISRGYANITDTANVGNLITGGFVNATGNVTGGNVIANNTAVVGNLKINSGGFVTGHLIPVENITQDLGNATNAWRDLWLSGSSIKLGTQTITSNADGITQSNAIFTTNITASGNIIGNSIYAVLDVKGGNVFANNLTTTNRVVLAGTNGKLVDDSGLSFASSQLTVTGNVNASASLVGANVLANNLTTTGRLVIAGSNGLLDDTSALLWTSGSTELTVTGSANVTANLVAGNISTGGTFSAGNISTGGNVVAANIYGNNLTSGGIALVGTSGHLLTSSNITYTTDSISVSNNIQANGNIVTDTIIARTTGDITISGGSANGNVILAPNGTGTISASSKRITSVDTPTQSTDAATKGYVDANAQGLDIKASVRLATTGNRVLIGLTAVDSVTPIAGDRILVKAQTTGSENGIYVAAAGAWSRAVDAVQDKITGGSFTFVEEGTEYADTGWVVSTNNPITVDTTAIVWTQFSSAGTVSVNVALSKTGNEINVKFDTTTLAVSGTNELKVADSAAFVTPNIGAATGSSLDLNTGNITAGNAIIGAGSGGSITGANLVSATYLGGTLTTAAQPNITSVGTLANLTVTADITANGNIRISNTPGAANGIFSDNYYYANGASIDFQTAAGGNFEIQFRKNGENSLDASADFKFYTSNNTMTTGNANVIGTTTTDEIIISSLTSTRVPFVDTNESLTDDSTFKFTTGTSTLEVGNATLTGTVQAANVNVSSLTSGRVTFASASGKLVDDADFTFSTGTNELTVTNANITTTLTAGNIIDSHLTVGQVVIAGAGKELSGVSGLTWDSGGSELIATNANVTTNLKAGNVTVAGLTVSGSIPYTVAGKLTDVATLYYESTAQSVYMPNANVSGSIYSGTTITAVGNVDGGNITTGGRVAATGNISGGNISGTYVGGTLTTVAQPNVTSVGTLTGLTVNGLSNVGPVGNLTITGGSDGQYLQTNGSGVLSWATVNQDRIANGTSNVSIPTSGGNINFVVGSTQVIAVTGTGANVTGTIDATGNISGNNITAGNLIVASGTVDSTSPITGTIKTAGGIAAQGNIYTGHSVGFADNNGGNISKAFIQFNSSSNSLDFIFN